MYTTRKSIFDNDKFYLILVFFLVFAGSNTIISQVVMSTQISIILIAAVLMALFVFKFRLNATKYSVRVVVILMFLVFFAMTINADTENFVGVLIIAVKLLSGFLLFSCFDRVRILKSFCKVLIVVSVASLIVTYIFPIFSLERFFPLVTNSSGIRFYNCFLSFKIDSYGYYSSRNYGIFSEPAVYCYYLFIAAISDLFLFAPSWKKYTTIAIMCVAMITTLSPVGFISVIPIVILAIIDMHKSKSVSTLQKLAMFLVILIVVVLLLSDEKIQHNLQFAIQKGDLSAGSGEGRLRSIWLDLAYWIRRPFFGRSLMTANKVTNTLGFNTSTTGTMLVSFGLIFSGMVTFMQYQSVKFFTKNKGVIVTIIFFVLYIVSINNHGFIQCDWYWYFAFIGICGAEKNVSTDPGIKHGVSGNPPPVHFVK